MTDGIAAVDRRVSPAVTHYAGFWKRTLALLIDVCIVTTVVSVVCLSLALVVPNLGKMITLDTPFGVGSVDRTIASRSAAPADSTGIEQTKTEKIIERSVLGRWVYRYRVEESGLGSHDTFTTRHDGAWQQIDTVTGEDIDAVGVDDISVVVLLLYWIVGDASRLQGTVGKRVLGLKVVDGQGQRLSLAAAAGRNLAKILSAMPALVGFMMAGWTARKQALHDMLSGSYVVAVE